MLGSGAAGLLPAAWLPLLPVLPPPAPGHRPAASCQAVTSTLLLPSPLHAARQAQFYAHGLGLNPAERRFRLGAALAMEAAVLLLLGAELRK